MSIDMELYYAEKEDRLNNSRDDLYFEGWEAGVHVAPVGREGSHVVVTEHGTVDAYDEEEAIRVWDRYLRTGALPTGY